MIVVRDYDPSGWAFLAVVLVMFSAPFLWAAWPMLAVIWGQVFEYMGEAGDRRLRKAQAEEAKARAEETRARADLIRQLTVNAQAGNVGPLLAELYRLQSVGVIDPLQARALTGQLLPPGYAPQAGQAWDIYRPTPAPSSVLDRALALIDQGEAALARRGW